MDADIKDIFDRKLTQKDQVKDIVAENRQRIKQKIQKLKELKDELETFSWFLFSGPTE